MLNTREKINGTSRKGFVETTYSELVKVFGEPVDMSEICGDGKVKAQWIIEGPTGVIATIYDYKEDAKPEDVTLWHIGGKNEDGEIFSATKKPEYPAVRMIAEIMHDNVSVFEIVE